MPFFRSILGFVIAGVTPSTFWSAFTNNFGGLGGWLAAFFLIGTLWYVNHHLGLIENKSEAGFIDMGLGIAICGTTNGVLTNGPIELLNSLPTLILVSIGGAIGGITAALIKKKD